ncbi:MAG TPA: hypothetical protein VGD50_06600 [Candidatus Baltobacteraceae bacterium]
MRTLESRLEAAGLSTAGIELIEPDDVQFAPIGGAMSDGLLLGDSSTRVPGVTTSSDLTTTASGDIIELLGDLEVPEAELDGYIAALGAGKRVIAYFAEPKTIEQAQAAFRAAGVEGVRVY